MKKRGGNTKESSILKEATYVLKCPSEGQSKQEVVDIFGGDERRVSLWIEFARLWIEFAKDSHLLDQNAFGKLSVLDKGRSWIESFS